MYEFCRFRTLNRNLPIENVDRSMKIYDTCEKNEIEDEFHYILECKYFNNVRKKYLDARYLCHK